MTICGGKVAVFRRNSSFRGGGRTLRCTVRLRVEYIAELLGVSIDVGVDGVGAVDVRKCGLGWTSLVNNTSHGVAIAANASSEASRKPNEFSGSSGNLLSNNNVRHKAEKLTGETARNSLL